MRALLRNIDRKTYVALGFLSVSLFVSLWLTLTLGGFVPPLFVPGPNEVLRQVTAGPAASEWAIDFIRSCSRVFAGFLLAGMVGIPIGLYIGALPTFGAIASPIVEMARYIPVPALLPLCILWAGVGEAEKILVIFLGTFFQVVVATAASTRSVSVDLVDVGRTLGLTDHEIIRRVVLPSISPSVLAILQLSLGWAWSYLVVAEIVAAGSGIGYRIMWSQRYLQVGLVFLGIVELAALGLATDYLFQLLRRRLFRWNQ